MARGCPNINQKKTRADAGAPVWLRFGPGSIFRGYFARSQQALPERAPANVGIVTAQAHDAEIVERVWAPCDGLGLAVSLMSDDPMEKRIVASVAAVLRAGRVAGCGEDLHAWRRKTRCAPSGRLGNPPRSHSPASFARHRPKASTNF